MKSVEEIFEGQQAQWKAEHIFEWRTKWLKEIPFITFPSHWVIQIVPPFAAAIVRFWVCKKEKIHLEKGISVYLDGYGMLGGVMGEPYWEIYPVGGDVERFRMEDVDLLLEGIEHALNDLK